MIRRNILRTSTSIATGATNDEPGLSQASLPGTDTTSSDGNLFLLPGGGNLWSDLASGERCHINFPIGPLEFIADYNVAAEVPAYQYCPLFAPPGQIVSQTAARAAATAALDALFHSPCAEDPKPRSSDDAAPPPRRAFFRGIAKR